ncbi:hypothetical protein QBC33DRAFT_191640 [Phialemonium atrogriseum]|uniref:Uncharacterized protein n=1 Tax=Phialemonium atrogriseum TaxID=1093897 RepID=A0AAJ0BUN6_9PEZI|nr:uncharacterized protein QBC33DRAFT_191640 [Phialemonium atrogriseum]KAK1764635.1 hypothetical protein QBC33DRAFT_191640 [Phialemonium atrogriseum]
MPIRNPFARRPGVVSPQDENVRPGSSSAADIAHPGFERVDTVGSKASSALSIRSGRSQDTGEYKMSVVNDSGVYLPPSPTEKEKSWPRRYLASRTSMETQSSLGEIEHFPISRESFDSYRRSFDISARSPIIITDPAPRQSLDSARFPRPPRSALAERRFERRAPPTAEEEFEDVGLNDDGNRQRQQHHHHQPTPQPPPAPRRKGFLSKFHPDSTTVPTTQDSPSATPTSAPLAPAPAAPATQAAPLSMSRFLPGRKRGHSGQGAQELGAMPPAAAADGMHRTPAPAVAEAQEVRS